MRSLRSFLASFLLVLCAIGAVPSLANAQSTSDPAERLKEADALINSGQPKAAYAVLNSVVDDYWQRIPMFVQKATFATNITGYGTYSERVPIFKVNEPQIIYVEPVGFGYGVRDDGKIFAAWAVDYNLTDTQGASLFQRNEFLKVNVPLGMHNREIHLTLTINLTGLQPGNYISHYVLKDQNSEKQTQFSLPFEVTE
ncbi:hypothetical protein [Cohaesibacter intestini]|uniref:hypothetical protein n=1 Tax=Cohaesibacter intestini TaxID=2211145 RepID=UPI000DEB2FCD|nr:hypothetical protein [Cohaesibacter intestini]